MVRIIDVCSGKGGVGKTTIVANLGVALQTLGKRVVVVDCNLTTSHLGLLFGNHSYPRTLNSFLKNESSLENALYSHPSGLKFVPASLELADMINVDVDDLKIKLKEAFHDFDFVLLDSSPGLGREALIALLAADELLFVANPYVPSLVDILKYNKLVTSLKSDQSVLGIVLNRMRNKKYEIPIGEIRHFTELPIFGIIPEDENVLESSNKQNLVIDSKKNSPASRAFFEIAAKLSGTVYTKQGIFDRLMKFFRR
jgi:septum site-determining protein MinD